jgi:hypothetical protein
MVWQWVNRTDDRSGLQWRYRETGNYIHVYVPGTDHPDDWRHHAMIQMVEAADGLWVTRADLALAADIVRIIGKTEKAIRIGGHSWGGGVAALVVWMLRLRGIDAHGWLYGPKQVGNRKFVADTERYITAYRHRGDLIPMILPWLASYRMKKIGSWKWPWIAHGPDTYHNQMKLEGFR